VDLRTPGGLARIDALNRGIFPFSIADPKLEVAVREAHAVGNLFACADPEAFASAAVVVVDVPLDVSARSGEAALDLDTFRSAVRTVGQHMSAGALVVIETTVPPGATALVAAPILGEELAARGLPLDGFKLAHCYERVTPGDAYFDSIVSMPRVYAGLDEGSAQACLAFLRTFVDTERHPPVRLASPTASELGKILENTYRAVTIALMEEFSNFAETVGVDLFEIVRSIRARPTHGNMRTPGFGVGGYCLTKDPLMARLAARELFGLDHAFPLASLAVEVNRASPRRTLDRLERLLDGRLCGRRILLLGVSYRQDVADTRHSPAQTFYRAATAKGAEILVHDPLVEHWPELDIPVPKAMPSPAGLDAVVLAVPHRQYRDFDYELWLAKSRPLLLDAFDVLSREQRARLRALGCRVESTGRGNGL
jgi:nucleotide sugar dehydrogenase